MRSLCVIGNSHIGAIKAGWTAAAAEFPGWNATFFGSIGNSLASLVVRNGVLTSDDETVLDTFRKTSGLAQVDIRPEDYDAIALVGLGWSGFSFSRLYFKHRLLRFATERSQLISRPCHDAAVRAAIEATVCLQLARTLRSVSGIPIWMLPVPQSSIAVLDEPDPESPWLLNLDMMGVLYATMLAEGAALAKRENVTLFNQPDSTLVSGCFTGRDYSRDAVSVFGLVKPHKDPLHMNDIYGAAVLRGLLPEIEATLARRPAAIDPPQKPYWPLSLLPRLRMNATSSAENAKRSVTDR